jgi:hypothetical protein
MEDFQHPEWDATSNETTVSDPKAFRDCEQALSALASHGDGAIVERRYSLSKQWGRVMRAKVNVAHNGVAGTLLATAWSGAGPGVHMAVEVEGCGPQQAGC